MILLMTSKNQNWQKKWGNVSGTNQNPRSKRVYIYTGHISDNKQQLYRIVQKYFCISKAELYTYSLQKERTLKIVIKGLLSVIPKTEITDDLKTKGYDIKLICQFANSAKEFIIFM